MTEEDLKSLQEGLESYFRLLTYGEFAGQPGVTDYGDGDICATFQHLLGTLGITNQAALPWISRVLQSLESYGYFWVNGEWANAPFDPPAPELGLGYSYPVRMFVRKLD